MQNELLTPETYAERQGSFLRKSLLAVMMPTKKHFETIKVWILTI